MLKLVKIKSGKGRALKFKLDDFENKVILREVFYSRNYFPRVTTDRDFKIEEKDIVIDIGANVGIFSVCAANAARKGKVYAFEPVKENFDRLTQHQKMNKLHNILLVNKGISNKNKKTLIYLCDKNSGGHSLNKNKSKELHEVIRGTEEIECITLKSVFDKYKIRRCNFLKIDCEGEEEKILSALPAGYFERIDKIALEFHHPIVDEIKLAKYLTKQGFRVTIDNLGHTLGMIFAMRKVE